MKMQSDSFRALLLVGLLIAGVFDAVAIHAMGLRLMLGVLLLVMAAVVLRLARDNGEQAAAKDEPVASAPVVTEPVASQAVASEAVVSERPAKKSMLKLSREKKEPREKKPFLPVRKPPLRTQVEALAQLTDVLSMKIAHHDGLRQAMWTELTGRLNELEAVQANELATLREGRDKHRVAVNQLQERVEAHKRALAELLEALSATQQPQAARVVEPVAVRPEPAEVAQLGTTASSF